MTIKFSIKHHYKDIPIEITVEAKDSYDLTKLLNETITWIANSRQLIDKMYQILRANTEKE